MCKPKTRARFLLAVFCLTLFCFTGNAASVDAVPVPAAAAGDWWSPGDVDGRGDVTAMDARLALRASVDLENYAAGSAPFLAADTDADGEISAMDARRILRASVDLEDPHTWASARQPAHADAFKIGLIGPMTGAAAIYGNAVRKGAELAIRELNALGGVQLALQALDDSHDAEKATDAYARLSGWGMQALIGPVTTRPAIAVAGRADEDGLFCLTPTASDASVIDRSDNMYQVCFTDSGQGAACADYLAADPGRFSDSRIAVVYNNTDAYSMSIRDTFVREAAAKGLDIAYEGTFTNETANDFSVQLSDAKAAGANVLFLPIFYTEAAVILRQAHEMNYSPVCIGVDGMDGILTAEGFDPALAEGVMILFPFIEDAPGAQAFVSAYRQAYGGETPGMFSAYGYDAVYILYAALTKAGCTVDMTASEICAALRAQMGSLGYDGLTGQDMRWDENGAVCKIPQMAVIRDGAYAAP
ncbi:MAG: ABC transporter substrate-binding protein [Clostridia bacterium]|nr:ABC transporter substrate-binding protein [Clostridia bacterium]